MRRCEIRAAGEYQNVTVSISLPTTMHAAFVDELGPAKSIRYGLLPVPRLADGDVLIRSEAMAVNHVDLFVRSGAYRTPMTFPFVVGRDVVGTVVAVGTEVTRFTPGDQVWCNSLGHHGRQGSFSELVAAPAERVYPLPPGVEAAQAVSVLHSVATAHLGLCREGGLASGDTIFIGGAGGAVGSAAVQLATSLGARVVAAASAADADWVRSCGAETVLDSRSSGLTASLAAQTPTGLSLYWDCAGRQNLIDAVPLMKTGGRIIVSAGLTATTPLPIGAMYTRDVSIRGFAITNATVGELREAADALNALFAARGIATRIGPRLPLSRAAEAHHLLETESGSTLGGKIVVTP